MNASDTIWTTSRIKAWYMTAFCGRRVRSVYARPTIGRAGLISYQRRWILVPSDGR